MNVTLTHIIEGRKIHAIKAIRALTGLGLKEAKEIADGLTNSYVSGEGYVGTIGQPATIEIRPPSNIDNPVEIQAWATQILDEGSVAYRFGKVTRSQRFRARLARYRRRLQVGWSNRNRRRNRLTRGLGLAIPVYVTRKNTDGFVGTWSVNAFFGFVIVLVVSLNIIVWGIYGLVAWTQVI